MVPASCAGVDYIIYTTFFISLQTLPEDNNVKQNVAIEISKVNVKKIIIELSQKKNYYQNYHK